MKVAMYWHNGRSLGHTAESAKVAHALVDGLPDVHIAGLTGAYRGLDLLPAEVDVIRLPGFANYDSPAGWGLRSKLGLAPEKHFGLRQELAEVLLRHYRPDVFLVNHLPQGEEAELVPALRGRHARRSVLTLRGVLFDREKTNRKYFLEPMASWIAEHFDAVTVHMPSEVFQLEQHYDVPAYLLDRVRYLGYLTDPHPTDRQTVRERLGWHAQDRWAVASMGGGQGALELWRRIVTALVANRRSLDRALLVTGPYLEPEAAAELRRLAEAHPWISVVEFSPGMPDLMRACDVFIGAAGSNMIAEALSAGSNTVLIPRQVREVEQQVHARLVRDRGFARMCDRAEVLAGDLDEVLGEALRAPLQPEAAGLLGGARRYPKLVRALHEGSAW
ncbi:glycosyltransferase family protein [Kitasatospora viridis]|uniref:Putative glycosyltransferase n=1 Tax=Kitasatospora viridis TaxID=281105 RepID=A0A561SDW6_9ACTN|nr:glycosyltransferase [Kitasatospora viridis]TWF73040.1 putative glycosyltransferase [Kitasatospora viridis]